MNKFYLLTCMISFLMFFACFNTEDWQRSSEERAIKEAQQEANKSKAVLNSATHQDGNFRINCGNSWGNVEYQIHTPSNWNHQLFGVLISPSPGTAYFSQTAAQHLENSNENVHLAHLKKQLGFLWVDPFEKILSGLLTQGYKVMEIRYRVQSQGSSDMEGFYSLCYHQGLDNVEKHNASLYDNIIAQLGYNPEAKDQRLIGFGYSLGALQLESMAFVSGRKFEKVGLTGVLMGNSVKGCMNRRFNAKPDGMGWGPYFVHLADALTTTGDGCSGNPTVSNVKMEFQERKHNFDYFLYRTRWDLGIFEGSDITQEGYPKQVEYIVAAREKQGGVKLGTGKTNKGADKDATTVHFYPQCGHDILALCPQREAAVADILTYFDPAKPGKDNP